MLAVVGPTASGKTSLAVDVALAVPGAEVVSADSRQVYRGMDIGTGKDLAEYERDGIVVPSHLLDIVDAGEKYNLFEFLYFCHGYIFHFIIQSIHDCQS